MNVFLYCIYQKIIPVPRCFSSAVCLFAIKKYLSQRNSIQTKKKNTHILLESLATFTLHRIQYGLNKYTIFIHKTVEVVFKTIFPAGCNRINICDLTIIKLHRKSFGKLYKTPKSFLLLSNTIKSWFLMRATRFLTIFSPAN